MPRGGKVRSTNEKLQWGRLSMADRRKELELAIDVAKQEVAASEQELFVYEVILRSLKKQRADLGHLKSARLRSKRARPNSLEASK